MVISEQYDIIPEMPISQLRKLLHQNYKWAFRYDLTSPKEQYYFWYYSRENGEPRLGVRKEEPGDEYELPLNIVESIQNLDAELSVFTEGDTVAEFLLHYPDFRWIIERVQSLQQHEYGEIRANLIAKEFLPVQAMRLLLSIFGAERFDPKSNKWVRVTLFQGAPLVEDLKSKKNIEWIFPSKPK